MFFLMAFKLNRETGLQIKALSDMEKRFMLSIMTQSRDQHLSWNEDVVLTPEDMRRVGCTWETEAEFAEVWDAFKAAGHALSEHTFTLEKPYSMFHFCTRPKADDAARTITVQLTIYAMRISISLHLRYFELVRAGKPADMDSILALPGILGK